MDECVSVEFATRTSWSLNGVEFIRRHTLTLPFADSDVVISEGCVNLFFNLFIMILLLFFFYFNFKSFRRLRISSESNNYCANSTNYIKQQQLPLDNGNILFV